jgi:hypothetical protein
VPIERRFTFFGPVLQAEQYRKHVGCSAPPAAPYSTASPLRNPTTGIGGCCARAVSGHAAAAPPSVAKNFRRPMWLAM